LQRFLAHRCFWPLAAGVTAAAFGSPVKSLLLGAGLALLGGNPRAQANGQLAKYLLQAAVVLLGFGLSLGVVLRVGAASLGLTLVTITLTMALALGLGRLLRVDRELATLLGGGTAICGGSAIAAIAPAIGAGAANTAAALAIVFLLNAVGLVVFPVLGGWLHLSQDQFGLWAALAIHDTSSVVGAAAVFGTHSLALATTVKLTRALWILPVSLACARHFQGQSGATVPWFLGGFVAAALLRTRFAGAEAVWDGLAAAGRLMMVATLFLVGSGLTRGSLRQIGPRPLVLAIGLWILVSVGTLGAIKIGWLELSLPL
jgi:uncharacterized integral membrane protein (TIGR00698 family)